MKGGERTLGIPPLPWIPRRWLAAHAYPGTPRGSETHFRHRRKHSPVECHSLYTGCPVQHHKLHYPIVIRYGVAGAAMLLPAGP